MGGAATPLPYDPEMRAVILSVADADERNERQ